jgi:para-aminobenzoate synthetase/4-amino-4-deoxychorismate lyase
MYFILMIPQKKCPLIYDAADQTWLYFSNPHEVLCTSAINNVVPMLEYINSQVNNHSMCAAGFLSYEASPAFDEALTVMVSGNFPLLWFGLYASPERITLPILSTDTINSLPQFAMPVSTLEYCSAIATIRECIAKGETYQVNYTMRLTAQDVPNPWQTFLRMTAAQKASYGAYLETDDHAICCASPEMLFEYRDGIIASRPMKGTEPRGLWSAQDIHQKRLLQKSSKNRAENVMITDMVRNDIGRVAINNTVRVPELFTIEQYPTVWQMTSTVTAQTKASIPEIMKAMFPAASITGAPKASTMNIICGLETSPRHIYTGSIGFILPEKAQFNVAIRTLLVNKHTGAAEYGTGGGITWPSDAEEEYAECRTKTAVLFTPPLPDFSLLETMLWTPEDGVFLLRQHIYRLLSSARYFGFTLNGLIIRNNLADTAGSLPPHAHRIRLTVAADGVPTITAVPFSPAQPSATPIGLSYASSPVDMSNVLLYHKTTQRSMYDKARAGMNDNEDVILWNAQGHVTETSRANIVIHSNGKLYTPPVSSGLLPGTLRAELIRKGVIHERIITRDDMQNAESIFVINALRKWRTAVLTNLHSDPK